MSPLEIDNILMEHEAIQQVVTFGVKDKLLGEAIGAAIVLKNEKKCSEIEIKSYARNHLADFKVPKYISFLKEIPYSSWKKSNIIYFDEYFKSSNKDVRKVYEYFPIKKNNFKNQLFINHKYWEQNFLNINKRWKKEIHN